MRLLVNRPSNFSIVAKYFECFGAFETFSVPTFYLAQLDS